MALSDWEKEQIIEQLEIMSDATRILVLASIEAFADWLADALYYIYIKIKGALKKLWKWLKKNLL
ncbi:MAG: hypothetical protein VSS52_008920 [Thiotrichaceae bacterium]|nr:hypothetical protein [Thiotrichaceae bacterium]